MVSRPLGYSQVKDWWVTVTVTADYAKSSSVIDAGLVNKMKTDAGLAYGDYGAVEAETAEEEMQEMADWDDLIQVLSLLA